MKFVSILGDSISTYEDFNPCRYAVYYDHGNSMINGLSSVYDTWWMKVSQSMHTSICVNNSFSGSCVSGKNFPAGESKERILNLRTNKFEPDYILVYIGFNDFAKGVPIRNDGLIRRFRHGSDTFEDAYKNMLNAIKTNYPNTIVMCGTLMRTVMKRDTEWVFPEQISGISYEDYNDAIRTACKKNNCYIVDLSAYDTRYETLDGVHPTAQGHDTIAWEWIRCLDGLGFLNN